MQTPTTDNHWLKAANWQEVLEDPDSLPADIRSYLETQNQTADQWLGGETSRQWIIDELKATIRDRDDSVPIWEGEFQYWQRFVEGAEHPDFLRQHHTQGEQLLLCGDKRASNHPYYDIGAADHSPNHQLFAVTEDRQGSERYTLTIFNAGSNQPLEPALVDCRGDFEWSTDSSKILYTRLDEHQRPSTVWCHLIGTNQSDDQLVFQLDHPGRFIGLGQTSSEAWITIDVHDHQTNQTFLLPASLDDLTLIKVTDWIEGLEYEVEHVEPYLIIRGNQHHEDFALFRAPIPTLTEPSNPDQWHTLWVPTQGHLFSDFEILKHHWIIEHSEEGCGRYFIAEPDPETFKIRQTLALESSIHDAHLDPLPGFERDQHFSAGVDLNAFRRMIEAGQWDEIDGFLLRFQTAVAALKYAPVPVVGAPSGLAAGGGFEVLAHCDKLVVHTNSVLGLVEAAVGVVPSGGGVKESYLRWHAHLGDWEQAAWKAWMNLGYAATGSSPELASRMQYFRQDHDETVMNRDRLLPRAIQLVTEMAASYTPPKPPKAELAPAALAEKMAGFMQDGVDRGDFMPHDKTVAMQIATIMVQSPDEDSPIDEDGLFARERAAFIRLAKTPETHARISAMLDDGAPVRN